MELIALVSFLLLTVTWMILPAGREQLAEERSRAIRTQAIGAEA